MSLFFLFYLFTLVSCKTEEEKDSDKFTLDNEYFIVADSEYRNNSNISKGMDYKFHFGVKK